MEVKLKFNEINVKEEQEKTLVKVLMLKGEKGDSVSAEWGTISGTITEQTDLKNALDSKANQSETTQALNSKANASDLNNYYTKSQMDTSLASKLGTEDIVDRLDSTSDDKVLAASQGKLLNDILLKKAYYFNNIANLKATNLHEGDFAITLGYYSANDGGAGEYEIVDDNTLVDNGGTIHELTNGLFAKLVIENNTINAKQFGIKGDGVSDDTLKIQNLFTKSLPLHKTIYFPNGIYLISGVIYVPVENYSYIKLDSKAEIKTDTDISELFNISKSASFFTIEGGIFNANNHANYCINSPSSTNKYSPNYKNIMFKNAKLSCFLSKDASHVSGSEHGYINNCKCYNENTLATGFEIYGGDYTVESCEIFYTNIGIKSGSILTLNDIHIWAGGSENPNNDTIGIYTSGSRIYMNNMYFDGMNICVDTGNNASTINANNILDFLPNESKTNKPCVFKTRMATRILLSNLDIFSYRERVYKINYSNLDMGNINNQNVNIAHTFENYGSGATYTLNQVDFGNCIFNDTRNFKALTKAYAQTLNNGKYYKVGYVVLRDGGVTGGNLNFSCDDLNKYSQDIFFTLFLNNGTVTIQSNSSKYNSGAIGRIGIAIGEMETLTGLNGETIYACPIYLHIVDNPGNAYGISVTSKSVNVGNWVEFFPYHHIDTIGVSEPNLLFDDITNS